MPKNIQICQKISKMPKVTKKWQKWQNFPKIVLWCFGRLFRVELKFFHISFAEIELSMCGWRSPRIVAKNWFTSRSCSTISGASFINGRSLWCSSTRSSHRSCRGNHVIARGKSETYVDLNWLWSKVVDLILFRPRSEYKMIYVDINWKRTMIVDLNWSKSTVVDLNWFLYATHTLDLSWFKIYCWKCKLIKIFYCRST